ncbi:MAG: hypothetical protein V2A79_10045 [Planctomycetota bacterium]
MKRGIFLTAVYALSALSLTYGVSQKAVPISGKTDKTSLKGEVVVERHDQYGNLIERQVFRNIVTDKGDDFAKSAIYTAAYTTWGMKLGTATTTATKSGAGSYIAVGDYVSGSAQALDDTTPKQGAAANICQFRNQWGAGEATNSNINRVSICANTTDAGEADATQTFSIAVFSGAINKGAADTLTVTWNVTYLGS